MIMRFSLTNEDLTTAYNAQLDYVCKPPIRHTIVATGCILLLGPIMAVICHFKAGVGGVDAVLALIGIVLIRAWAVAPIIKRREIQKENGALKMIRLIIDENTVIEESGDSVKAVREWAEIDRIVEMPKGFIFYFHNEPLMWLPTRVFESEDARMEFMHLAAQKGKL